MPIPVHLNIYDLMPQESDPPATSVVAQQQHSSMGCYHTGLEILGREVSFGRDASGHNDPNMEGVFMVAPRTACAFWKEQVLLGVWASSTEPDTIDEEMIICHYETKLEEVLRALRPKWRAASYHMLNHNCNDFTFDLATAIASTGESRGVQVGSKSLLDRYPKWINRAAGVGNKVVPDALLTKMLDSIQPPTACAPDLINIIMIPSPFGDCIAAPLDLCSTPTRRVTGDRPSDEDVPQQSSSSGGLFGGLKSAIKTVATKTKTLASAHIHDRDEKQFKVRFGDIAGTDVLVSAYTVTVRHINREQPSSKVFVTPQALYFSGPNELKLTVPWSCVGSIRLANVTERKAEVGVGNAAPVYTLLSENDVKFHAKEAPVHTKTDNNNSNCGPQFAIMVFLTSIPPQLAPVSATILKQMVHHNVNDNNVGGNEEGGVKPPLPMIIPMRKFVYGTFYSNLEVVQNALGHMNHMWQSSRAE